MHFIFHVLMDIYDVVKFLLESKVNINLKDRWGNTALHELKINKDKNPSRYNKIIQLFKDI